MAMHTQDPASQGRPVVYRQVPTLTPGLTLADLPSHECQVNPATLGQVIGAAFEKYGNLPGVIVWNAGNVLGMISRPVFFKQLSRPFGQEL